MIKLKNNSPKTSLSNRPWTLIYLVLTAFTIFLVINLWNRFLSNPTLTSLESSVHPVNKIPYPGVSLCNINKISKKRAENLTEYIVRRTGGSYEKVMRSVKFLGNLHDSTYDVSDKTQIQGFQEILDSLQLKIIGLMETLITPCEELLQTCHWKGVQVNCSDIFNLRLTYQGYCCVFNYAKNTSEWWKRRENHNRSLAVERLDTPGKENGLSVRVNNNLEDYFYTIQATTGIDVHVFIPTDYPDKSSGNLFESMAAIGTENFLEVIPTTVAAVKDVMNYPVDKRNCLFEVEQITQFGFYSQSDCFVDCRIKSMMTLCQCIPFTIPFSDDETVCTLRDLHCLDRHERKWLSLVPDTMWDQPMKEHEDALRCPGVCYPSCAATLYEVSTSAVPFFKFLWQYCFSKGFQNETVIHVYYRDRYHNLYKQDVVYYWFEILSFYGGIFGLIMGVSFILVIEGVIYSIKFVINIC